MRIHEEHAETRKYNFEFRKITWEYTLYCLFLLLALFVRMLNLGKAPLSDAEANWALQALNLAHPGPATEGIRIGSQPGYISLTGAAFALFSSPNTLARFWPALAGGMLTLIPAFFRRQLGRKAALILAFGLAIDPGLTVVSRQAGGPMLALSFTLLALGFWNIQKRVLAGIFAGLALLSGPAVFSGILGLGLAWVTSRLLGLLPPDVPIRTDKVPPGCTHPPASEAQEEQADVTAVPSGTIRHKPAPGNVFRSAIISAAITILLVGSMFLWFPQGLAAWFGTLPAYLYGWAIPSGTPVLRLAVAILLYQPWAVVFGLIGAFRGWMDNPDVPIRSYRSGSEFLIGSTGSTLPHLPLMPRSRLAPFLTLWFLISLILALLYPGRQVSDLVWVLVPLLGLAAMEVARHIPVSETNLLGCTASTLPPHPLRPNLVSLGQAGLTFILFGLAWMTLTNLSNTPLNSDDVIRRLAILGILTAIGTIITSLVSIGWTWTASRTGLVWGASAGFLVYMLAVMMGATQLRPNAPVELWTTPPGPGEVALFQKTVGELSDWQTGFRQQIDITSAVDTPSLRWALRDYPELHIVVIPDTNRQYPAAEMPSIYITRQGQEQPSLSARQYPAASYRGQDFAWWVQPGWTSALPDGFIRWLTFREAPVIKEQIILWARSDLFSGEMPTGPGTGAGQP